MTYRGLLFVVFSLGPLSTPVQQLSLEPPSIRIRVYGRQAVPNVALESAAKKIRTILGGIGVVFEWVDCEGPASDERCGAAPEQGEFLVRILRLRTDKASHGCGVSLRPRGEDLGHLITVYADCVRKGAEEVQVSESVVLAYTIMHEIGHLLLPVGHSATGLMSARPDRFDWQRAARGRLRFTERETQQIRDALINSSSAVAARQGGSSAAGDASAGDAQGRSIHRISP